MSENLDLLRSIFADWERGDFSHGEWADPDIEWVLVEGPSPDGWKGRTEAREGFRDWTSAWEEFCVEADEYRPARRRASARAHSGERSRKEERT